MDEPELREKSFSVVLCGDAGVGKSSFVRRLINGTWIPDAPATVGVSYNYYVGTPQMDRPRYKIRLGIWDVAGQERFRSLCTKQSNEADVLLFAFDITDRHSFESIEVLRLEDAKWTFDQETGRWGRADRPALAWLVGTKSDLAARRFMSAEDTLLWAKQHDMGYMETSAFQGDSVYSEINILLRYLHDVDSIGKLEPDITPDDLLSTLHEDEDDDYVYPPSCCCCCHLSGKRRAQRTQYM